jgi:hypothetical protein
MMVSTDAQKHIDPKIGKHLVALTRLTALRNRSAPLLREMRKVTTINANIDGTSQKARARPESRLIETVS